MLPFLQNKIGIQGSVSEPIKRDADAPEDSFLSDLKLAHALLGDHEGLAQAKSIIQSVIESLEKGNQ